MKRFAEFTDAEIEEKRQKSVPMATTKANLKAKRILELYVSEKNLAPIDFGSITPSELDTVLSKFYLEARTVTGDHYKASSLMNFRHSLNRLLQSVPFDRNINVVKDPAFRQSNETFKTAMRELKTLGNGEVDHYPQITLSDLRKIYNFMSCDSPRSLADKVQFDIRFYFCRRGCENIHAMTKDTFEVCVDGEGNEFVRQARGELNKNHNETDREGYTGFMPAHAGSELCPVAAFKNYVSHLNPMCDSLWQRPLDSVASTRVVWYYNRPIGVNTLATFMRRLSEKCSLSKTYSNHSVRVTGVTLLRQLRFGQKQVMSVSGHKSVSSMVVYERVSDEDKMLMGRSLTALLAGLPPPIQPAQPILQQPLPAAMTSSGAIEAAPVASCSAIANIADVEQPAALPPTMSTSVVPAPAPRASASPVPASPRDVGDFSFSPLLRDLDLDPEFNMSETLRHAPSFHNCVIKNMNINVMIKK